MTDYEALVKCGHTPEKAKQIALEAERGLDLAKKWIATCRFAVESQAKETDDE